MDELLEHQVRLYAFQWLFDQVLHYGQLLPRNILEKGFMFKNQRIPLVSPQGIFKPKILNYPLTITTTTSGPYEDDFRINEGVIVYKYRGKDPNHRDNVGLRNAMINSIPLIYFDGIAPGKYFPVWPVYIKGDDPANLSFTLVADDYQAFRDKDTQYLISGDPDSRRAYITREIRQRLHQSLFRENVLRAYRVQCAICRLKHPELLDAAHIIPDNKPKGLPLVSNGISLCKLHHAAFDRYFIGVRPDYIVEVRTDIMSEKDGPMLKHGLKGIDQTKIILPKQSENWPDQSNLNKRWDQFKNAV